MSDCAHKCNICPRRELPELCPICGQPSGELLCIVEAAAALKISVDETIALVNDGYLVANNTPGRGKTVDIFHATVHLYLEKDVRESARFLVAFCIGMGADNNRLRRRIQKMKGTAK